MFRWCGRAAAAMSNEPEAMDAFGQLEPTLVLPSKWPMTCSTFNPAHLVKLSLRTSGIKIRATPLFWPPTVNRLFDRNSRLRGKMDTLTEERIQQLGRAVISTGAAEQTFEAIRKEVDHGLHQLGHYIQRPGCRDIAAWAEGMWQRFAQEEAV